MAQVRPQQVEKLAKALAEVTRLASVSWREDAVCCGVTLAQCHILTTLAEAGRATMKALSHALGIAPSTLTRTIEPLVASGWVRREAGEGDRRRVVVGLSRQGRVKARELKSYQQDFCRRLLEGLAGRERERLVGSLEIFLTVLEREMHEACCPQAPAIDRR